MTQIYIFHHIIEMLISDLPEASCPAAIHDHVSQPEIETLSCGLKREQNVKRFASPQVADDVIYADVVLPVGSDRVSFSQGQDTEYACIRYQ